MNAPEAAIVPDHAGAFSAEQKEYLQGFTAGLAAGNTFSAGKPAGGETAAVAVAAEERWFGWPVDEITNEEKMKRERDPLDMWEMVLQHARENRAPVGGDVYRFKFFGLFYVAPAQDAFMVRVRIPGNVLSSAQLSALAAIASELGDGRGDVTTRGNIQIRGIEPKSVVDLLTRLADVGLSSRGAGADNVRNITASPLAGIDPLELIDTRPLAKALQIYLNNSRDLFGLPRKFNVSFDGGGAVSAVTDTNDIGFIATQVEEAEGLAAGIYFRAYLAGITGHQRFADDCGLLVAPSEAVAVTAAMLRVFAEHGDRTDRKKARLCYVLDRIGVQRFLELVQEKLAFPLRFAAPEIGSKRSPVDKHGHLGVRAQSQPGYSSIGVAIPVGRMAARQMRGLARIAETFGDGSLRVTVWQNVIVPNVADDRLKGACAAIKALGFATDASRVLGCVVACTGNTGCRFSATDTKSQAVVLAQHLDQRVKLSQPINIHLTGCPHSCAQHYIADIGLLGAQVAQGNGSEGAVEGYHVYVGGGVEQERGLGRELVKNVAFADLPPLVERLLKGYLEERADAESFVDYARRSDLATLRRLAGVPEESEER
jgi:ferredoxin-nitrite reductase